MNTTYSESEKQYDTLQELQEKKQHGDLGFPMEIYKNDFSAYVANRIPWHWHEELEFVCVTEGRVEIFTGTETCVLKKGEGIFINSNVLHQMIPRGEEKVYMFTVVCHPNILGTEKGFLLSSRYVLPVTHDEGIKRVAFTGKNPWEKEALAALQTMYTTYNRKEFGYEYKLRNLICEIWFLLLRNQWQEEKETSTWKSVDENRIQRALDYLQKNYQRAVTLEEICIYLNVSKSECCRCFQKTIGMTPFEYLMLYRISMAAKQLENSRNTVSQIGMQTGFRSSSYFCKLFKKYMQISPLEYRRRCENNSRK